MLSVGHSISSYVSLSISLFLCRPHSHSGVGVSSASHSALNDSPPLCIHLTHGCSVYFCMCGLKVQTHLLHLSYLHRPGQVLSLSCVHFIAIWLGTLEWKLFIDILIVDMGVCLCSCTCKFGQISRCVYYPEGTDDRLQPQNICFYC